MLSRILDPWPIARLQSWDPEASTPPIINQLVGAVWPREVGSVATALVDVLCIGPADWLVIGNEANGSDLSERLSRALAGSPFTATDVSQALARIELEGPYVRDFLLKGCSLDLHPDYFRVGRCARTRFAGVPTVLHCRASSTFEAIVAASYRDYWLAWIADASA